MRSSLGLVDVLALNEAQVQDPRGQQERKVVTTCTESGGLWASSIQTPSAVTSHQLYEGPELRRDAVELSHGSLGEWDSNNSLTICWIGLFLQSCRTTPASTPFCGATSGPRPRLANSSSVHALVDFTPYRPPKLEGVWSNRARTRGSSP
jgi:hypothetical protein